MSTDTPREHVTNARTHLVNARHLAGGDAEDQMRSIAQSLAGILTALVAEDDTETAEDALREMNDRADKALGRVLDLAETLDEQPGASLKPVAFGTLPDREVRFQPTRPEGNTR